MDGITSFPSSARGVVDHSVTVTCVASGNSYADSASWFLNGVDVASLNIGTIASLGGFHIVYNVKLVET